MHFGVDGAGCVGSSQREPSVDCKDMASGVSAKDDDVTPESPHAETAIADEAHDAIWAAMPVVTLTLADAARAPRRDKNVSHCEDSDSDEEVPIEGHVGGRPGVEVQRWNVSDSESEDSSSSASGGVAVVAASDSTGQGLEGLEEDVEELVGLFAGATSDESYNLPTVEEEQRRLQEIIARRQEVQNTNARDAKRHFKTL
eukprot:328387-Amphidinium_carterae.1